VSEVRRERVACGCRPKEAMQCQGLQSRSRASSPGQTRQGCSDTKTSERCRSVLTDTPRNHQYRVVLRNGSSMLFGLRFRRKPRRTFCSNCRNTMIPIIYGMPGDVLLDMAHRGEVQIGGCVILPNQPKWHCKSCGRQS